MAKVNSVESYRGIHNRIQFTDIKPSDIRFRNFSGVENKFNAAGNRNFKLVIDDEESVAILQDAGLHIVTREDSRAGGMPSYQLKVNLSYRFDEPYIVLMSGMNMTKIDQDTVTILDNVEIVDIPHLIITTANNSYNDHKIAYLEELGITKRQNDFRDNCEAQLNSAGLASVEESEANPF